MIDRLTEAAPLRTEPWFVARIVESYILAQGTTPSLTPLSLIGLPLPLIRDIPIPTPPPCEVKRISSELASAIPSIESPTLIPKHEIGIPRSVPKLESTGDAKHSQFLTIAS